MITTIADTPPLNADQRIYLIAELDKKGANFSACQKDIEALVDLFARFAMRGAFFEPCPDLRWMSSLIGTTLTITFNRLPSSGAALGVLARMFLSLPTPPLELRVQGTQGFSHSRSLPPLSVSLMMQPELRTPLSFRVELEPGSKWLCVEVRRALGLDMHTAKLLEAQCTLWMEVCRCGGLSDLAPDYTIQRGDLGMDTPAVGTDFWSAQIAFDDIAVTAPNALVNLFDELARSQVKFDYVTLT